MSELHFLGTVSTSKHQLNRALIAKSFYPELDIKGDSNCDDIKFMKSALKAFSNNKKEFDCGEAGAVLRFLALRVSRQKGEFILTGSKRLFTRPQNDLLKILMQLGADVEMGESFLKIKSYGWKPQGDGLHVNQNQSSQFLSAVLLSAWDLPQPLFIYLNSKEAVSQSYLNLTLSFLGSLGMAIKFSKDGYYIEKNQKPNVNKVSLEPDMSSCYALACHALLRGSARINNFPHHSAQPDFAFVNFLKLLGAEIYYKENTLVIKKTKNLVPIAIEFNDIPDMFPMTAALYGFFPQSSKLYGAKHLSLKETDRVINSIKLLNLVGRKATRWNEGLIIEAGKPHDTMSPAIFDEDQDHRMAMAASLYMAMDFPLRLKHPEAVNKSYPEFWSSIGMQA